MRKGQKKGDYKGVKLSELSGNSTLTKEILSSVEIFLGEGLTTKQICEKLGIPRSTWETWRINNTAGFEDFLVNTRRKLLLDISEENMLVLQRNTDPKIVLDVSKFVSSTLGKQWYSTRSETKALPIDEKLEEEEKDRLNDLLKDNKKETTKEKVETYKEVSISNS